MINKPKLSQCFFSLAGKEMCVDMNCDENFVFYVELNKK